MLKTRFTFQDSIFTLTSTEHDFVAVQETDRVYYPLATEFGNQKLISESAFDEFLVRDLVPQRPIRPLHASIFLTA